MTSFEHGEDSVSQRLDFDIDARGLDVAREINTELEHIRVNTEAAARGMDSFTRYVDMLTNAETRAVETSRNLVVWLERIASMQDRMGASPTSTAIPPGYTAPWTGVAAGMGGGDRGHLPTTIPTGGAQTSWDALASHDPRAYLNARTAWGGNQTGDIPSGSLNEEALSRLASHLAQRDGDQQLQEVKRNTQQEQPSSPTSPSPRQTSSGSTPWDSWRNRAANWMGHASAAIGALAPGGSGTSLASRLAGGMQSWAKGQADPVNRMQTPASKPPQPSSPSAPSGGPTPSGGPAGSGGGEGDDPDESGGTRSLLGDLGPIAGWAGAGLGLAAGGFAAFQKTGSEIQQYRALGQIRGGGFGEGFGYEMQARMMALNPFITNEQSRQIIQSALTSGYTGQEFDTVTAFMADNLKHMNMSIVDSSKLLQAGQRNSTESAIALTKTLRESLDAIQGMSAFGYASSPQRQAAFSSVYGGLTDAGYSPEQAAMSGRAAGQIFFDRPDMADVGADVENLQGNMSFQMMMLSMGGAGGKPLGVDLGGDPGSLPDILAGRGPGANDDAMWNTLKRFAEMSRGNVFVFQRFMMKFGLKLNRNNAKDLMHRALSYGTGGPGDPKAPRTVKTEKHPLGLVGGFKWLGGAIGDFGDMLGGGVDALSDSLGLGDVLPHFGSDPGDDLKKKLSSMYGGGIEVGDGNHWTPFDPSNKQQLEDLKNGKLKTRRSGDSGGGQGMGQLPSSSQGDPSTGTGAGRSGAVHSSGLSGTLQIQVKPESMRQVLNIPSHVPITANEQQANSGFGTATKNNPPPGDTITTRGSRGI